MKKEIMVKTRNGGCFAIKNIVDHLHIKGFDFYMTHNMDEMQSTIYKVENGVFIGERNTQKTTIVDFIKSKKHNNC